MVCSLCEGNGDGLCDACEDRITKSYRVKIAELERQLAEALTQLSYERERNQLNVAMAYEERDALKAVVERAQIVVEAARKLNPWCMVTHGHVLSGWAELLVALAALDEGKRAEKQVVLPEGCLPPDSQAGPPGVELKVGKEAQG